MNLRSIQTILLSALAVAASSAVSLAGCGGSFDVPKDHFDGVDAFGYVSYWDKIADIDIGEDTPLPLVIGFKSNRETSSPYLGHGWVMPLLDSYMIQTGDNTFEIMKPTGYTSGFGRDPKIPTTIGGVKGWKGEIGSNTIKVWAPCGWSLTYALGRLTEMGTPKGKRVIVKRDQAGQVEDVTMDGKVLVKVVKGLGGKVEALEIEGKKYAIALGEKPRIQNVQGNNLIVGKDLSVARILSGSTSTDLIREFTYALDRNLQPTMTVKRAGHRERDIVWSAANRLVSRDGNWIYNVKSGAGPSDNSAIERMNGNNQTEFWHLDAQNGVETVRSMDGTQKIKRWFTSGKLNGKPRSVTSVKGAKETVMRSWSYDENGALIRFYIQMNSPHIFTYKYNEAGKQSEVFVDGKLHIQKFYDEQGRLVKKTLAGGIVKTFNYTTQGIEEVITSGNGIYKVRQLDKMFRKIDQEDLHLSTSIL